MANISYVHGDCLVTFPDGDPKELIEKINQVTQEWYCFIDFSQVSHYSGLTYKCQFEAGGRWAFAGLLEILGPRLSESAPEDIIKFLEEKEWFLCFEYLDHEPNNGVLKMNQTQIDHEAGQPLSDIEAKTTLIEDLQCQFD